MDKLAVIMAGGTGTRFWPMSRSDRPKQVISLEDDRTMLENTIRRLRHVYNLENIYVITSREHRQPVREACGDLPPENVIGEPEGRDTAACAGWAGLIAREELGPETVIGVFPADHRISPREKFITAVEAASQAATELDGLVTFGIRPAFASTGYGYINYDESESREFSQKKVFAVKKFTEKPDKKLARQFIEAGDYLWNSGMFFWTARRILAEIEEYMPGLSEGLEKIRDDWQQSRSWEKAAESHYSTLPQTSIDYGILEKSSRVWTLPVDFDWLDLGTWDALENLFERDDAGNVVFGDCEIVDGTNNIIVSAEGPFIGCVGAEDLIVVTTDDAVLVCDRNRAEEVKKLVNKLKGADMDELL